MPELRIFGPPGTGKTTKLQHILTELLEKSVRKEQILVASYTKTAARELTSRAVDLQESIGTLHSHCYRKLGRVEVMADHINDFNKEHKQFALASTNRKSLDEPASDISFETDTDKIYAKYQYSREQLWPRNTWQREIQAFANVYEGYKKANSLIDFTDMIETVIDQEIPSGANYGVFDEAQDFTPMQLKCVRQWGQGMHEFYLAGDDDQCLYTFVGANPDAFINPPLPDNQKIILNQSYRVPRVVQSYADTWIKQVTNREPKEYKPRAEEGVIRRTHYDMDSYYILEEITSYIDAKKSVMLLAATSYMLHSLIMNLRDAGIPFQNEYRRNRGDWNPLHGGVGVSSSDRLLAFLRPSQRAWGDNARMWTGGDLLRWSEAVQQKGVFLRGIRTQIESLNPLEEVPLTWLAEHMVPLALDKAFDLDLEWFYESLLNAKKGPMLFPLTVYEQRGAEALRTEPLVTVGTIHSVKGGQSDIVYVSPDISKEAAKDWLTRGPKRDAIIRQFYVAFTRAKEELVLCTASTRYAINVPAVRTV